MKIDKNAVKSYLVIETSIRALSEKEDGYIDKGTLHNFDGVMQKIDLLIQYISLDVAFASGGLTLKDIDYISSITEYGDLSEATHGNFVFNDYLIYNHPDTDTILNAINEFLGDNEIYASIALSLCSARINFGSEFVESLMDNILLTGLLVRPLNTDALITAIGSLESLNFMYKYSKFKLKFGL